jgi:uncharacterized membrane-anchored protein YjiN (DUF445 family)
MKRVALSYGMPGQNPAQQGRDMRQIATSLLVIMAIIFIATRYVESNYAAASPAIGFVRAFAEAAMVGGLADWFAVTALFRHPMGIPIPHTAIIPNNKDRIGDTLAHFLKSNFLIPRIISRRMRTLDVAGAIGKFLAEPVGGSGRFRLGASRMLADMLAAFDQNRLGGMVKSGLADQIRKLDAAPLLGQVLDAAIRDGRHLPLLDGIVVWAAKVLDENDYMIRFMVHDRANAVLRWTGLDDKLADAIVTGLQKLLSEMASDPAHPFRAKAEEGLADLAQKLQHDPEMQARVARIRDEMIENPAMKNWLDGLWEQGREALLKAARDPETALAGRLGETLRSLGATLADDAKLNRTINRFARRAVIGAVESYGDTALTLITDTVRGWDAQTLTDRVERVVGDDLQFIRINGTLVGGLAGLAIHSIGLLL